jgi:hypothetical protein
MIKGKSGASSTSLAISCSFNSSRSICSTLKVNSFTSSRSCTLLAVPNKARRLSNIPLSDGLLRCSKTESGAKQTFHRAVGPQRTLRKFATLRRLRNCVLKLFPFFRSVTRP